MKQIFTIFCLAIVVLLAQQGAFAQPTDGITFRQNWYNYVAPNPAWEDWNDVYDKVDGRGFEIGYNRNLSKHTWLYVPAKIGVAQFAAGRKNELGGNLDVIFQNNLFRHGALINPTVSLGVGTTYNFGAKEFDVNIPASIGLNIRLMSNLYANVQSQYRFSLDSRPGWHHGVGLVTYFGESNPDRDKDGIADKDDTCPDVPGVAAMLGCPDKDGDMITDAEDDCPDVKGLAAFKGCPDTDNDGIKDADDKCPLEAGPAANNGCPVLDRDGDGINDNVDKCPDAKGPAATGGCPDRDADGVADKDDACPDKKGTSMHKGCPDTDGDGIYDNDDRCPEKPGVAALNGCPEVKKEDKAKLERAVKLVQFELGKDVLLATSFPILDEVVSVMKQYSEYSLSITGHTDNQGDDKLNLDLSQRRAKRCYDYLLTKGVAATRMSFTGLGETQPAGDNKTAAGREQNRRVVFELFVK